MSSLTVSLDAVIVAVTDETPKILTIDDPDGRPGLPSGPIGDEATLELSLRRWVREQSGLDLGYVEQLYTFGDADRRIGDRRHLSIGYLALVAEEAPSAGARWIGWYELLPWEDQRDGSPPVFADRIGPALAVWSDGEASRQDRARLAFGLDGVAWDGVRALERYELMFDAGLLPEHPVVGVEAAPSVAMHHDHRRIVATALSRLRGKLTYRPLVFELLPDRFTLSQLQGIVESLAGTRLHTQNFRRLVERAGLVEGTDDHVQTGGRPAELFRFRPEVLLERPRPGLGTPWT